MLKSFISYVVLIACILINYQLKSQNYNLKSCGFDHQHDIKMQNISYQKLIQSSEEKIATFLNTPNTRSSHHIYTIPIVVHVLHLGENIGVGTNISNAQIQSAITNLNDVYRGQTAGSPVDFEIEFTLAQQDPSCNPHSGINRINASSVPNYSSGGVDYYGDGGEADETILKDLSRWPETDYFNIWIVSEIENNNGGFGIQGYANFFTGSAYEGSVMMATVFGFDPTNAQPSFNLNWPRDNSTVVHEIGHYLHLHHTFKGDGDANNDGIGDACPADVTIGVDSDGCADTEPHKRYTSQCKSGLLNDCTGATFGDNTAKNFMSYASCQDRLTNDQKNRSRAMLASSGQSLIYSQGDETPIISSGSLANANCIPQSSSTATSSGYGGIMNFTIINEFSASSSNAQNDGGYVDFTTNCLKTISLEEDSTYNYELTTFYNAHVYKSYIDFNNDGDFFDVNEQQVFSGSVPPSPQLSNPLNPNLDPTSTVSGIFTIPISDGVNVLANTPLRLRIISEVIGGGPASNGITGPCYNPFYAQAEDYQLVISQSTVTLSADFTANNENICLGNSITFSDISSGSPTSWTWDFGDGNSSILQNPTHTYSNAGTYNVSLIVSDGASSDSETKTAFITVGSTVNTLENITSCNNYNWNGFNYSQSGNYIDTLQSSIGCDSIVTLNLTINNSGNSIENINACNSYIWNGTIYNQSGTYIDTLQTSNGCDSVLTLNLTINNSTSSQEIISICSSYNWNGTIYSQSGIYYDTLQSINGCDSIITLNLTVSNYINSQENISTCNYYFWNGTIYSQSGIYYDTILVSGGCDSILTLDLSIYPTIYSTENIDACGSYFWNGNIYSQSGTYIDTLTSNSGCDSIISLNLTLNQSITYNESITICDSYFWNGNNYSQSGNYVDTLISNSGCDSIISLILTINNSSFTQENISTCGSYLWNGNTYSQSGTYFDTLQTILGCDSIITLNLISYQPTSNTSTVVSCDTFVWNNTTLTQSGIYTDSLQTSNGCDSLAILNLTINNTLFNYDTATVCNSYNWNGILIDSSGIYIDSLQTSNGCDSINILYLIINNDISAPLTIEILLDDYCLETYWTIKDSQDSIWYSEGPYDCNPSGGGNQANTTIVKDLYLADNECYTFDMNDYYGDGLSASQYGGIDGNWLLIDFNNVIVSQGQGNFGYNLSQSFYVNQSSPLLIENMENKVPKITVFPNPLKDQLNINIENENGPYFFELYDLSGRIVKSFNSYSNNTIINNLNVLHGTYWLRIKNKSNLKPIILVIE